MIFCNDKLYYQVLKRTHNKPPSNFQTFLKFTKRSDKSGLRLPVRTFHFLISNIQVG